jgi:release factor glutamine methyltransferase
MTATLVSSWKAARDRLRAAGVEQPVLDARILVEAGAGVSRLDIVTDPHRALDEAQQRAIAALVARREAREPVARIVGKKAFWKFELAVSPAVLTPRPETEFLVELAFEILPRESAARVLDLGVGSGAILLAILSERPFVSGIGLDSALGALAVAQANAAAHGLGDRAAFVHGEWEHTFAERFDLVVANPPYIASADIGSLEPEVAAHEPHAALDGGADGLDAHRRIAARLPALLKPGGAFALEVGAGQGAAVVSLASGAGLETSPPRADLSGIARVVWGRSRG